ncbi:MAG: hypothetical protein HQL76_01920 [Magnetococcales bacterium]|nr:hypothetical protein [Magnetococcales bacterium]
MISIDDVKMHVKHPRRFFELNTVPAFVVMLFIIWICGISLLTNFFKIDSIRESLDRELCSGTQYGFIFMKDQKDSSQDDQTTLLIQSVKTAANSARINELKNLRVFVKGKNKEMIEVNYIGTFEKFFLMVKELERSGHQLSDASLELVNEEGNIDALAIKFSLQRANFPTFHIRDDFEKVPNDLREFIDPSAENIEKGFLPQYTSEKCTFDLEKLKYADGSFPKGSVPSVFGTLFSELAKVATFNKSQKKFYASIAGSSEEKRSDVPVEFRNPFHEYIRYMGENYLKIPGYYKLDRLEIIDDKGQVDINGVTYRTGERFPRNAFHKNGTAFSNLGSLLVYSIDPKGHVLFRQDNVYPDYLLLPPLDVL